MSTTATERRPLTEKQQKVYEFVWMFREQRGYCCTIRELMDHFGMDSPNGVMCHLWPLRKKGWVTWEDGQARTLRPVEVVNE